MKPHMSQYLPRLEKEKFILQTHRDQKSVRLHDHAFLELTYILDGTARHTLDGQTTMLSRGDYLIVDYGSKHSYETDGGKSFDNLDCLFLPELLDPVLKGTKSLRTILEHYLLHFNIKMLVQNPAHMVFHDDTRRIRELLALMEQETDRKEAGYLELVRCYLIEILLLTMRRLDDAASAATGQSIGAFLTAYVADHYMESITLSALADRLHYSLPYVSKRFQEEVGISFVEYLQNYRVMQGCRLLTATRKSLSEITELVGYRDVKFFASLVKRITGLSPSDFRRRNRYQSII